MSIYTILRAENEIRISFGFGNANLFVYSIVDSYFAVEGNTLSFSSGARNITIPSNEIVNFNSSEQTLVEFLGSLLKGEPDTNFITKLPFTVNFDVNKFSLAVVGTEYLMFLFKPKLGLQSDVEISNIRISSLSDDLGDMLLRVGANQTYDYTFLDSDFIEVDPDSKMLFSRANFGTLPVIGAVPASVLVTTQGRQLFSDYVKQRDPLRVTVDKVFLPKDQSILLDITLTAASVAILADSYVAVSWIETVKS